MAWYNRREFPIALLTISGLLQLVEYYYPVPILKSIASMSRSWGILIFSIAIGVGVVTLASRYIRQVQKKAEGWIYNLWALLLLTITIMVGLLPPLGAHAYLMWMYESIFQPTSATMYALLGFFICSAALRAFKARTLEAGLMLFCAVIIVFSNAGISSAAWPPITLVADWLFNIPNKAGQRAILMGSALGIILIGYRTFLGREKAVIGEAG